MPETGKFYGLSWANIACDTKRQRYENESYVLFSMFCLRWDEPKYFIKAATENQLRQVRPHGGTARASPDQNPPAPSPSNIQQEQAYGSCRRPAMSLPDAWSRMGWTRAR